MFRCLLHGHQGHVHRRTTDERIRPLDAAHEPFGHSRLYLTRGRPTGPAGRHRSRAAKETAPKWALPTPQKKSKRILLPKLGDKPPTLNLAAVTEHPRNRNPVPSQSEFPWRLAGGLATVARGGIINRDLN